MGLLRLSEANSHAKVTQLVSGKAELEPGLSDTKVLNYYVVLGSLHLVRRLSHACCLTYVCINEQVNECVINE